MQGLDVALANTGNVYSGFAAHSSTSISRRLKRFTPAATSAGWHY